ncbi:hypothetical protein [Caulobacter hibisci]|uniref:Uncharacterized protein n=1 Tax=Caulobacter hibisci TaxID=2035993 RepID=A0ABS0SVK1_9CAUL|nr:hypothetical protein [Caulobacter hibisci]MBI1683665.1 hypothetical protein [Caulobacter hibisci]
MKVFAFLGLAACLAAAPAMAGPAGHGLTHTEAVAKQNLAKRTVKIQTTCAQSAASAAASRQGVAKAKPQDGLVHVVFNSAADAAAHEGAVRAAVSEACRAA